MLIVADYDADGATAVRRGVRALRMMGAQVDYIVPNRFEHSYGLSPGDRARGGEAFSRAC
jgi:single-stranded-DNA-specific exonuclease